MKSRRCLALTALAAVVLLGASRLPAGPAVDLDKLKDAYQQAQKAYEAKDYPAYLKAVTEALRYFPNHPILLYRQAGAFALNGQPLKALAPLRRTAGMGLVFDIWDNSDFRSLQHRPEFKTVMNLYARNARPLKGSRRAFAIPGKGLLIEGLAYDPHSKKFLASSVRRREILTVDRSGRTAPLSRPEDGLWAVMGLRVDASRRLLWAAMSALPQMEGYKAEDQGRAGLACYDLKTGALRTKYVLPGKPETHLLGDLAVDAEGTVVATDSQAPVIYAVPRTGDALEVLLQNDDFQSLQGIDFSPDGKTLFVADYSVGVYAIDRQTKAVRLLEPPRGTALIGIDGLYFFRGSLLGVQNGLRPNRVIRMFLDPDYSRILKVSVLEANEPSMSEPTLGVVVDDAFYFNANSQWSLVDDRGRAAPDDKWQDPVILEIGLTEAEGKK
jgi:hypothetical protein